MSDTPRALLVGAGGMGKTWGRNLRDNADAATLAGWVDLRPGAAGEAAEELGLPGVATGTDFAQLLADVRPDFVIDVTIPEAHRDITITALNAGVPVLGEKPMAHSMEAAREMVAASEKSGKLYMVSQSRRYDARLHAYRALIEQIGAVGILNADFYLAPHFGGFRDEMDNVLLLDMAIHTFDAARYLLGDTAPVSVYCEEFNPSWSWYKGDACATALFEMADSVRFTYRGSWCAEGLTSSWECDWRTVGAMGTAKWDGHAAPVVQTVAAPDGFNSKLSEPETAEVAKGIPGGIAGSLRDFVNALATGQTPMGECHDNIKSLAMVFAAIESAATGKRVPIVL
ncbi:MAG: Gfo/Idh/MocA family oxidoreductase [Armatimonadetes bacterium]|nr:Gfo/Idh/MocA family oxidoreductase [Armatimonadota bacterium]